MVAPEITMSSSVDNTTADETTPTTVNTSILDTSGFARIPFEIKKQIFEQLNPSAEICLALTNRYFYVLVRQIICGTKTSYRESLGYPACLSMQCDPNSDSEYYDFEKTGSDIVPSRPLFELIGSERLFMGMRCCPECFKFKPEAAWEYFDLEEQCYARSPDDWQWYEEWYTGLCRRCRAMQLLMVLSSREPVYEQNWQQDGDTRKMEGLRISKEEYEAMCQAGLEDTLDQHVVRLTPSLDRTISFVTKKSLCEKMGI